ncbi:glycosyltransferase family 4 protein [Vibrio coralliirubri]|uniref:glycosyltransferase family 4 protein n=1 Tax=Vibrio coralliirubri TaxID=1516159 RepID=UPI000A3B5551|nr:glycosyltransferase [Vibrio coralliirubri]
MVRSILWVVNVPLPEYSHMVGLKVCNFGGWLLNASSYLSKSSGFRLSISFPDYSLKPGETKIVVGEHITYYAFGKFDIKDHTIVNDVIRDSKADVVHVFGTELEHSYSFSLESRKLNIESVVSIQGLVSVISKHVSTRVPKIMQFPFTFRSLIRGDSINGLRALYSRRGEYEKNTLRLSGNVIGRTDWDKACVELINPQANYFHVNETLRPTFYEKLWDIDLVQKRSIFVSQGNMPFKGLNVVLEAMALLTGKYPDLRLYLAGTDPTRSKCKLKYVTMTSYGAYLDWLISKLNIRSNVVFLGNISESDYVDRLTRSHVFVSASSIENSPNSVCEAMLVGTPVISSFVGGVSSLCEHKKSAMLYQHNAEYMLANYISEVFENDDLALSLSYHAKEKAKVTHDIPRNGADLIEVYETILRN